MINILMFLVVMMSQASATVLNMINNKNLLILFNITPQLSSKNDSLVSRHKSVLHVNGSTYKLAQMCDTQCQSFSLVT